jgi:STE24 endopeptidase
MSASAVLAIFLALFLLQYALETALLLLELRHVGAARGVPSSLAGWVSEETAERSRAYTLARGKLGLVAGTAAAAFTLLLLLSGALPAIDRALAAAGLEGAHRFVAFLAAVTLLLGLAGIPASLWSTFVLEARFGFNRTTPRLWLVDHAKGLLVQAALGIPLLYAVHAFFARTGRHWWIWLFGFVAAVQLVLTWLYPAVIAPLFNRFSPLAEGPLRARLVALAAEAGFAHRGLFVVDASRRSGHSNAYLTGVFRPRIVLYDTLVASMSEDEAASVLAHEIGHFTRRHVHRRVAVSLAATFVALFVVSRVIASPTIHAAFGFDAPSLHAALALLSLGGGALVFWVAPLAAAWSRRHELEADRYAVRLARAPAALKHALVRLNGENLSNLHPHPWYAAWHYSHPPLVRRLAAVDRAAAQAAP